MQQALMRDAWGADCRHRGLPAFGPLKPRGPLIRVAGRSGGYPDGELFRMDMEDGAYMMALFEGADECGFAAVGTTHTCSA